MRLNIPTATAALLLFATRPTTAQLDSDFTEVPASPAASCVQSYWEKVLMGKRYSDETAKTETTFSENDLPSRHRVLPPGSIMTMDYIPHRLNVHIDEEGKVVSVNCG